VAGDLPHGQPLPVVVATALNQVREEEARYPATPSPLARATAALASLDVAPGLEELEMGAARAQVNDKRMITTLNQLVPFKVAVQAAP
jgi:ribonucleoside-diphosphate reductase beta chain